MAAETSMDAHVPVSLALFKMAMFYGSELFNKEVSVKCINFPNACTVV